MTPTKTRFLNMDHAELARIADGLLDALKLARESLYSIHPVDQSEADRAAIEAIDFAIELAEYR